MRTFTQSRRPSPDSNASCATHAFIEEGASGRHAEVALESESALRVCAETLLLAAPEASFAQQSATATWQRNVSPCGGGLHVEVTLTP